MTTIVDHSVPALTAVMDPAELSRIFGQRLWADRLRYKPGLSVLARVHCEDGSLRWLAGYTPEQTVKAGKVLDRATDAGLTVQLEELPGQDGHLLLLAPLELDPKLRRTIQRLSRHGVPLQAAEVLNYNPQRRLVLSFADPYSDSNTGRVVAKVSSAPSAAGPLLLNELRDHGIPVLERIRPAALPRDQHLAVYPWYGTSDLHRLNLAGSAQTAPLAHQAGSALARLHAVRALTPGAVPEGHGHTAEAPGRRLRRLAEDAAAVVPELAARLHRAAVELADRLSAPRQRVLLHGDFSADQVLTDGHYIRLIDFDRWTYGPPESDLGCFAAVDILDQRADTALMEALLAGYDDGGAAPPNPAAMDHWTAFHLMARILDPFRDCEPDWRPRIHTRLDLVERYLR